MESSTVIQDKLRDWNFRDLIKRFEDEEINNKTFLGLDTSEHLKVLIPKVGPRVKFRKRLKEYKQSLNRQHDEEMMETNVETNADPALDQEESHHVTRSFPSQSLITQRGFLATQLFVLRHHLTDPVQDDLMTLLKSLIPNFTPDSIFNTGRFAIQKYNGEGLFLFSSLKDLLKDTLENYGLKLLSKAVICENELNDIMDGKAYQKLIHKTLADDDITMLLNFDSAPVEEISIWPLQFTINELPYQIRKQNVLVPALWCGKGRPNMEEILRPFVNECLEIEKAPLKWTDGNGAAHSSRVFVLICSSDAVARPFLRNSTQFNGEYGCDWCLHPGTMVDKGSGKIRSYANDEQKQQARCEEMHQQYASRAKGLGKPVKGIKGLSFLQELPVFDIVRGFVPEYSHAVLLGVTKQLVFLWLEEKNLTEPWYIGDREDELDSRHLGLRSKITITRVPISLKYRDKWKAVDWEAFILFYGTYVLQPYLESKYLHHFYLLSCSVHILLQDSITQESLNRAHFYLKDFVQKMAELYGEEHVTFNCHQLIHLCDSVENWGPLWATSALVFERNNKDLQALLRDVINSHDGIVKKFGIWQNIPNHLRSFVFGKLHFNELINLNPPQNVEKVIYTPRGHCYPLDISDSVQLAVQDLLKGTGMVRAYECFTNGHRVYHCANSKADKTKCTIKLKNGSYGEIHFYLEVKARCKCTSDCLCPSTRVFVAKMLDTSPVSEELSLFVEGRLTEELRGFFIHDIKSECVYVDGWIVPLPNALEGY
ncbi:uncharacterized protein [Eucyclogobius newberryi]|uniref:uncharacterized protein n=1 Tax=Eucyclogobius newberryi TaxID=166745 RepID=UPI003B591C38